MSTNTLTVSAGGLRLERMIYTYIRYIIIIIIMYIRNAVVAEIVGGSFVSVALRETFFTMKRFFFLSSRKYASSPFENPCAEVTRPGADPSRSLITSPSALLGLLTNLFAFIFLFIIFFFFLFFSINPLEHNTRGVAVLFGSARVHFSPRPLPPPPSIIA